MKDYRLVNYKSQALSVQLSMDMRSYELRVVNVMELKWKKKFSRMNNMLSQWFRYSNYPRSFVSTSAERK
ncbi:CLUMA_CG003055, isoform A [Clunio marinus]|uniref:CLUMA_CG003055, isoform A n=1 Tax=Clunio marinus TaxID=568069 RepID=A0A1J1HMK4_9DIPT|nr:CLUMA_CG003055, isoform A [Clunio marinus]